MTISELSERFNVTKMTIRRDLNRLDREGHVRKTRGGAVLAERMIFEFDFRRRRERQAAAKLAIAQEARKMAHEGDRIILDTGTTTLALGVLLKDREDLTVITTSLAVMSELQFADGVRVVLLGGELRGGSPDLTGAVTEYCVDLLAADILFQGADGIALDGSMYNEDLRLARVDGKLRKCAQRTYVLCDSTKIGRTALARNGSLAEVDGLITDSAIEDEPLRSLEESGAHVIVAPIDMDVGKV